MHQLPAFDHRDKACIKVILGAPTSTRLRRRGLEPRRHLGLEPGHVLNTAYALGVSNKEADKTSRDHAAFKELHLEQLADEIDEGLLALRRFLEAWSPDQFAPPLFDEKMIEQNVAFLSSGFQILRFSNFLIDFIWGAFLLLVIAINVTRNRLR